MSHSLAGAPTAVDAALHRAMQAEAPRLGALAGRMMGNEADAADVMQEAWLRAWSNRETFRGEGPPAAWLRAIVVRECWRSLRWRGVRRWLPFGERGDEHAEELAVADPAAGADTMLHARRVRSLVEALPAKQRLVVGLRYDEGWSIAEIATALDLSPETIRTHLARGLDRVRTTLGNKHAH